MKNHQFESLAVVWGVFLILAALTIIFSDANFIALAILATAAAVGTIMITGEEGKKADTGDLAEKSKRIPAPDNTRALLELLDDDDLYELRQRVKDRLMERIEGGTDGELSTLEVLLLERRNGKNSDYRS